MAWLVSGGLPRVWNLPWIDAWRLGEPPSLEFVPKAVRAMVTDLSDLTPSLTGIERNPDDRRIPPHTARTAAATVFYLADGGVVPDPGTGSAPPGFEGFITILEWTKWISLGICVIGLMVAGATMAINSRRGEGGEHLGKLGMVLGGVVVISAATSLISFLVTGGGDS